MNNFRPILFFILFLIHSLGHTTLYVGVAKTEITPTIGTPSADYSDRQGAGMEGVHDPLLAIALFIDNGEKQVVLCSVDHLGFTHEMVQEITDQVHALPELKACEIYIASSHTHSGGGAYLNIPVVGEGLAGAYSKEVTRFYVQQTVKAILQASQDLQPAKIGIGYGEAQAISKYRAAWPLDVSPISTVTVLKVTTLEDTPIAVLFNYPMHPTVLRSENRLFSADFVGYSRDHLQVLLGSGVQPLFFNGAQGDINPLIPDAEDRFGACEKLGKSLAETVQAIWNETETSDTLQIETAKDSYAFVPQATPFGLKLPVEQYETELNLIVLNRKHAFVAIPGELSTLYDRRLKEMGKELGYSHVSIFGLTNDAHGYIILPEAWRHKTYESGLSFGGEFYGEQVIERAAVLLKR
jgi:neutral ceramidase